MFWFLGVVRMLINDMFVILSTSVGAGVLISAVSYTLGLTLFGALSLFKNIERG